MRWYFIGLWATQIRGHNKKLLHYQWKFPILYQCMLPTLHHKHSGDIYHAEHFPLRQDPLREFTLLNTDETMFNSLWPSDAIWRQRSGSTLAQVMACCLTAPSHYLTQCWLIISKVQWHSFKGKFTRHTSAINHWNYLENWVPKISFKFPRGQWVKWNPQINNPLFLCCGFTENLNVTVGVPLIYRIYYTPGKDIHELS